MTAVLEAERETVTTSEEEETTLSSADVDFDQDTSERTSPAFFVPGDGVGASVGGFLLYATVHRVITAAAWYYNAW